VSGVQGVFEQQVEQLKKQRDSRLEELKIELDTVNRVMQIEQRRYSPTGQTQQTAVIADMRGLRRAG
jgi:hypothetical protein